MRVLCLYAHPVESSFAAALHRHAVETLRRVGHEVDDCDLYAEGFDPVLSRAERIGYHAAPANRGPVAAYVERLLAAEALLLVFPVWTFGFPAILKGYFDRVFVPGVAVTSDAAGGQASGLPTIRRLGAVCTYGVTRWRAAAAGDPPRRLVGRVLRAHMAPRARCDYLAAYDMNHTTPARRMAFLERVETCLAGWR